jgi:predicted lipoprotein
MRLFEADLWDQLPADLPEFLALLPRADLYLQDEMQVAFHPTLTRVWSRKGRRGQRLVEAPGDNRHPSTALAWSTGARAGSMAGSLRGAQPMCSASKCVPPWLVPAQRGRVAIVIADNLKTHTSAGSLLVRSMLTELQEHLYVV